MVESTAGKPITCKAAVAFKPKEPMQVVNIIVEAPKANEVRVKVIANALCHTDVYTWSGQDPEGLFPSILGHEATAVVESVGAGVTKYKVGDLVVPCYTPQCKEWDCIYCQSNKTNLCPRIRATQGKGLMPDGTSRLKVAETGEQLFHFMGCSTFAEYAVLADISLAMMNPQSDPYKICVLGCGVPTGWGAVYNNPDFHSRSSVAVWGLGAVGLAVIQAAKLKGATRIYGIDINPDKFKIGAEMGCTKCFNPMDKDFKEQVLAQEKWGVNFTFDCTGNVNVMRDALELAHRGFGQSTVLGVAAAGQELKTRPFQLITGRCWKGTAFGGWKSLDDVPKLANKVLTGEMPIDWSITHNFDGLEKISDLIEALHSGACLRGVMKIHEYKVPEQEQIQVLKTVKHHGGYLKTVKHWSESCHCFMTFNMWLPEDEVQKQRCEPYPVIYYLSGMTSNHENATFKSGFGPHAKKHGLAIVFPDTSPRNLEGYENFEGLHPPTNPTWSVGYGAGQYCDATKAPWSKHFNMYTYCSEELPRFVEKYFHISSEKRSILGHSMGGNGALTIAARNPEKYRCVSAFAPMGHPMESGIAMDAIQAYFGSNEGYKQFDCSEVINSKGKDFKMPNGLIDTGSFDDMMQYLSPDALQQALGQNGHTNVTYRWQEGYGHDNFFVSTFLEEHIQFHANHLKN